MMEGLRADHGETIDGETQLERELLNAEDRLF